MEEKKCWCVYIHISPSNKAYIGITSGKPEYRWQNGLGYLKKTKYGDYTQPAIARAINKYGWDSFEHVVWADCLTKEQACKYEQILISLFNTQDRQYGYNISNGGDDGGKGRVVSDITKSRLSASHKGKESPLKNKSLTEEHKQKLKESFRNSPNRGEEWRKKVSDGKRGKKLSEEACRHISEGQKGRIVSTETRRKISEANKERVIDEEWARKLGDATRKEMVVCVETGIIYECAYSVELKLGIKNVRRACDPNSGRHTAGGYHWRYATEEDFSREKNIVV